MERLIKLCLAKDPAERWQSAHDLVLELQWLTDGGVAEGPTAQARRSRIWIAVPVVAILSIAAIAVTGIITSRRAPVAEPQIVKFTISPPDKMTFDVAGSVGFAAITIGEISPDGSKFAFTTRDPSRKITLWLRPLGSLSSQPLAGTDDAAAPFWSPDSRSIAFFAQGKLKKVDIGGGIPQTICDAPNAGGGTWNKDGVILFGTRGGIFRVSTAGGEAIPVIRRAGLPSFLPDGKHFLYGNADAGTRGISIGSIDSPDTQRLMDADSAAVYAPSGHVLFVRQGTLLAQQFDSVKMQLIGEPVPVTEELAYDSPARTFSVADNGTLAYRSGTAAQRMQLTWVDRTGKVIAPVGEPGPISGNEVSPNGKQIAIHRHENKGGDLWLIEAADGKTTRLTFDPSQDNASPVWSPDGKYIAFSSNRGGKSGIYRKLSNGTGAEDLLFESADLKSPISWSADGNFILFAAESSKTRVDIWKLPLNGDRKPIPIVQTPFAETHPQISPDGKWIAYFSNETGRDEVYVQSFPPGAGKWQISGNGGVLPRWRRDGGELFYMDALTGGRLFSVTVKATGSTLEFSSPRALFDHGYVQNNFGHRGFWEIISLSADGRFLIPRPESDLNLGGTKAPVTIVLNWASELAKK